MSVPHGSFCWYELMTPDPDAAATFYGHVMGWEMQSVPGSDYRIFTRGGRQVAGLMGMPDLARRNGAPPRWLGYVAVEDVDATAARATGLGGRTYFPTTDISGVGRLAVIGDPQGAALALFRPAEGAEGGTLPQGSPGGIGWHELLAADREAAFGFYAALLGWEKAEAVDIGPMGLYQLFAHRGRTVGGMVNKPTELPACVWLYYFCVGDIDAAAARATEAGARLRLGPMQVPGGDWILQATDPQGVTFALLGRRDQK